MEIKTENYNVYLYNSYNIDQNTNEKYRLLDISKYKKDKLIKQNFLYIHSDLNYKIDFENELLLDELINIKKNSKIKNINTSLNIILRGK